MMLLFQIALFHGYFTSGVFDSCQIVPDQETQDLMRTYSLLMRSESGKGSIYYSGSNSPLNFLNYLQSRLSGTPLRFLLLNSTSEFAQITDLPLNYVGQIKFSTQNCQGKLKKDADGYLSELTPTLAGQQVKQLNVIGIIDVYLDDCIASRGQAICYAIQFSSRKLHWLYYVINRSQNKLHQPTICDQKEVCFESPTHVALTTGEAALSFSSGKHEFPLSQRPELSFDLIDKLPPSPYASESDSTIKHCLIKGLPTPDGTNLKLKEVDSQLYAYGEVYVYL